MGKAAPPPPSTFHSEPRPGGSGLTTLGVTMAIVAGLYFGREIFVPFALGILLSFVLAPLTLWLRRWHLGRIPSVVVAVALAFLVIFGIGAVIAGQVTNLAENLPRYQQNIQAKIHTLQGTGGGVLDRAASMLNDLGREIAEAPQKAGKQARTVPGASGSDRAETDPIPVVIRQPDPAPLQVIQNIVGPLLAPLATTGIVIVFVIFILLQREDLRDRLIRLAGPQDIQRTTEALDDAAKRVSHYLVANLIVNTTYGVPIGLGLWAIGVPNPVLWGILAALLRFIPYIGPWIAALFPLALAVAVDEGWTMLIWAVALFLAVELISNNVVEPWLYGSSTGLSAMAIIAAATFWTWLWGPVGLLLSTPLTSCVVVLGRHVPQLQFLDVLLGNRAVLTPEESFYQRILAGDPDETAEQAEQYLEEHSLADWYDEVAIEGLALAARDQARGKLGEERRIRVHASVESLIDNLADTPDESGYPVLQEDELPPAWRGEPVFCISGRGHLDEAASALFADLLRKHGIGARVVPCEAVQPNAFGSLDLAGAHIIVLSFLDPGAFSPARFLVRRLRRRRPEARILVGFWTLSQNERERRDPLAATGADLAAASLREALDLVLRAAREGVEPRAAAE